MSKSNIGRTGVSELSRNNRKYVFTGVLLAIATIAISSTIVTAAMPTIVADLGGFHLLGWVFSVYLLTQAVTVPVYGKLADMFGRRPVFFVGCGLFVLGSVLCGLAPSMEALVGFRALQGIGAGAVYPVASVIVGDIYAPEDRAKVQGMISAVWGTLSVAGPALGAFFVSHWSWSLVFWVNIPFGIAAIVVLALFHRENITRQKRRIDYLGSALLMLATSTLMVALIQGAALGPVLLGALILAAIGFTALFIVQESRAREPMMPLDLWRSRVINVGNWGSLTTGALIMGVSSFLPVYVQGVLGAPPAIAGYVLAALALSWPIASTLAGRLMLRTSYRVTALVGVVFLVLGCFSLLALTPALGAVWIGACAFTLGLGMGFTTSTFIISIQTSVDWNRRGVATSSNAFMRTVGMAVGAALCGAVVNLKLHNDAPGQTAIVDRLMDPASRAAIAPEMIELLSGLIAMALHDVYIVCTVMALITTVLVFFLPVGLKPQTRAKGGQS